MNTLLHREVLQNVGEKVGGYPRKWSGVNRRSAQVEEGWPPLRYAVLANSTSAVNLLLDAGADIEAPTPKHQVNRAELRRG